MMTQPCRVAAVHAAHQHRVFTPFAAMARVLRSTVVAVAVTVMMACGGDMVSVEMGGVSLSMSSGASLAAIDSWRVTISGPSGSQTRTGSAGSTVEFKELQTGNYSVLLEGFEGADVATSGQTNVTVVAGGTATATVSLVPVLPVLTVVASDPNAAEVGPDPGMFTISRAGPSSGALLVNVAIAGTAAAGADYQAIAPSFSMSSGQRSVSVSVIPVLDALAESAETVVLTVTGGSGYVVGTPASATVVIADSPLGPAKLALVPPPPRNAVSGVPFAGAVVVQLQDTAGNLTSASGTVTAAISLRPPGTTTGVLVGAMTVQASGGAATFPGLGLNGPGGEYVLTFTSPGLTLATAPVTLIQTLASLAITRQPSSPMPMSGVAFTVQPQVELRYPETSPGSQSIAQQKTNCHRPGAPALPRQRYHRQRRPDP